MVFIAYRSILIIFILYRVMFVILIKTLHLVKM